MIDDLPDTNTSNCRKYRSNNPAVRWALERFLGEVVRTVEELSPSSVVDLGCGEGVVARAVHRRLPDVDYLGVDTSKRSIESARAVDPELRFEVRSLFEVPAADERADLALCLEVLEHLPDPDRTVSAVLSWTADHALISVPWEPYFRLGNLLRVRYLEDWGDHPEHLQHFNPETLHRLLERHATVNRVWTRFPWVLALISP